LGQGIGWSGDAFQGLVGAFFNDTSSITTTEPAKPIDCFYLLKHSFQKEVNKNVCFPQGISQI